MHMAQNEYIDVELHLLSRRRARLRCPGQQEYAGDVSLDDELFRRLLELDNARDPQGYGRTLFEAVFPPGSEMQRGIYSIFDSTRKDKRRLRLRLNIDSGAPPQTSTLHWELLTDGKDFEVGRSPETVFSRYIPRPYVVPTQARPRMLCVIAAPIDVHRYNMAPIDYDYTVRQLEKSFADLRASLEIEFLDRPVTPERLRAQLRRKRYDLLHIHGHGALPRQGESALVLENDDHKVKFTTESALRGILLGLRDLKLVTLVACHGGAQSSQDDLMSGLAGSLVQQNVPAVVAMRRAISMKMGFRFTRYFYAQLAENPCVDAAINEARHQLYMDNSEGLDWSSPVLYMRLEDGLLWLPSRDEAATAGRGARARARRPTARWVLVAALVVVLGSGAVYWQLVGDEPPSNIDPEPKATSIDPPPPPVVVKPALEPIAPGKIGVGAIDGSARTWSADISQIAVRWLRNNLGDLDVVSIPGSLHGDLATIAGGDLSAFPGSDRSPGGFEYLFLLVETHGPHGAARAPFPTVSVRCEMILVDTRKPRVVLDASADHLGQGITETAALEQAFERCLESSIDELRRIT